MTKKGDFHSFLHFFTKFHHSDEFFANFGFPAVAFILDVAGVSAVAVVPAVDGVFAVASFPTDPGVPMFL